jgi:VIT1/CCC1 family predicted Fe2+/Mn2+ transporter
MNDTTEPTSLHPEIQGTNTSSKLNQLRAAVLGANDGIVSTAGIIVGVAGATDSKSIILTAGIAGILAGALSMAAGEYVSVSTQRDTEQALLEKERLELSNNPDEELAELAQLYQSKGLQASTAQLVAKELTAKDAFAAHADAELGIDPNNLTNPWHAAYASAISFTVGSLIPLITIMLPLGKLSVPATFAAVVVALIVAGYLSAKAGNANRVVAIRRVVIGGVLAMIVTYTIGSLLHVAGI